MLTINIENCKITEIIFKKILDLIIVYSKLGHGYKKYLKKN